MVNRIPRPARLRLGVAALAMTLVAIPVSAPPASAQAPPIQTQETQYDGVVAELIEAKRKDGVLNLRVRVRNNGASGKEVLFTHKAGWDGFYVTAGNKKYLVLKDSEKNAIGTHESYINLGQGRSFVWWAKFAAPPADQKKFNFVTPMGPPFEDVPIAD